MISLAIIMMCYWGYTSPSHPLDLRKFVGQAQEEIQRITKKGVKSLGPLVTVGDHWCYIGNLPWEFEKNWWFTKILEHKQHNSSC